MTYKTLAKKYGLKHELAIRDAITYLYNTTEWDDYRNRNIQICIDYLTTTTTLREVGKRNNITASRVDQIIEKCIRMMIHTSRSENNWGCYGLKCYLKKKPVTPNSQY